MLTVLQEAVAERISHSDCSSPPLCCATHTKVKPPAQTLRGVRLASLMHGRPEAIPFTEGRPLFMRSHPDPDLCRTSAAWKCLIGNKHHPLVRLTDDIRRSPARCFFLPTNERDIFASMYVRTMTVLEGPQLKVVLSTLARMRERKPLTCRLSGIEEVVRPAFNNGNSLLMRQWLTDTVKPR
jgi:hypothetical protein